MLHILHILPAITIGGLWRHLLLAMQLPETRYRSTILSLFDADQKQALERLKVPTIRLKIPLEDFRMEEAISKEVSRVLAFTRPDVVNSYHYYSDIYTLSNTDPNCPIIRSVHGITQISADNPFKRELIKYDWSHTEIRRELELDRNCKATIVVSEDLRQKLISYGFAAEKLALIYPGVDLKEFNQDIFGEKIQRIRREFAKKGDVVVGYVGRLEPVKNPLVVPEIARHIKMKGLGVKFLIVGEGRLHSELVAKVEEYGLRNEFMIIDMTPEISRIMAAFDILLITSLSEGMPLTLLEAMALGIPVISTPVGGIPEVIVNGRNGYMFNPPDINEVVNILVRLVFERQMLANIRSEGKKTVEERFTLAIHLSNLEGIYSKVVSGNIWC